MNCPHCQTANPDTAKFCLNCGAALTESIATCPTCATALVPGANYCHHCGRPLAEPQPEPAQARLQQYIPRELLAKLEAARASHHMEGERRVVTVLFCDVKGSTALAERLDPEEWAEIMNGAFERLIAPVYRYEGTVARLMGDAILAFFGAPIAHEDDAQRAVLAGLDILTGMQAYRERLQRERGLDFDVRVGINTGLTVVGEVGSDLRVEYTAMGDAVNLAARMEQTARPGTVQISEQTYRLVAPLFECQALGGIEVKGKSQPVPAYCVLRPRAKPGRVRGIEGLEAPLVGRASEMRVLQQLLAEVRQGRGQIACLIGEAGLGKSRLINELRAGWQAALSKKTPLPFGVTRLWVESQGFSYATTRPYGLWQQLYRYLTGTTESDPPGVVRKRLALLLKDGPSEAYRARVLRVFDVLLSVEGRSAAGDSLSHPEAPRSGQATLEGEALKRELFEVMLQTVHDLPSRSPAVMVFDDLHWADPASMELLLHVLQLADEVPILFLCAFRPNPRSLAWRVKDVAEARYAHRYTEIALDPLSVEDSRALVNSLIAVSDLPPRLRDQILQKAEGNPFFVEEVVRALIEGGVVVREDHGDATGDRPQWRVVAGEEPEGISIPGSLQALIMARIDRLEEGARHTLQRAAVIGRTFYYRVLKLISGEEGALDEHLQALRRADLIRETVSLPEPEYVFQHALTQETAYHSILLKRRREYHRRVGETLETLFADRIEEYAPLLAHHFYEAGDARAQKYDTLAGDAAARLYANIEAAAHYARALEVAKRGGAGGEPLRHLYSSRGKALELNGQYDEALENYTEMEAVARERDDRALELAALMARATVHATFTPAHNPEQGEALLAQALGLARDLHDRVAESKILWNLMLVNLFSNRLHAAVEHGEPALALARQLGLREQLAFTLNDIGRAYIGLGQVESADAALREARALWQDLGNLPMLADNLALASQAHYFAGEYDPALALSEQALRISTSIHNPWGQSYSRLMAGYIYLDRGQPGRAIETMTECIRMAEEGGLVAGLVGIRADLGWAYGVLGEIDRGLDLARLGREAAEARLPAWKPWPLAVLVRLHLLKGNLAEAEARVEEIHAHQVSIPFGHAVAVIALAECEFALAKRDYDQAANRADRLLTARPESMRPDIPEALYLKGKALLGLGREEEALGVLRTARLEAQALGSRRSLWPILMAMSEFEARRGDHAEAHRLCREAQEVVVYIADHIGSPDLRASFLNLPAVRAAVEGQAAQWPGAPDFN